MYIDLTTDRVRVTEARSNSPDRMFVECFARRVLCKLFFFFSSIPILLPISDNN